MITKVQIEEIQEKIFSLTLDQVKYGNQSKGLPEGVLACGQFLERERMQRGVHGTSAALLILTAFKEKDSNEVVPQLVKYLENRKQIEEKINPDKTKEIDLDENNIIKLSEQLYSFSLIKASQGNPSSQIELIKEKICKCKLDEKGWGYFVNQTGNPELLPTSFAVMGLFANGFNDHPGAIKFIIDELKKDITNPTSFAIAVFSLYVLVFKVDKKNVSDLYNSALLDTTLSKLYNSKFCVLDENIEQNIEYWSEEEHFYVRIPWQLYLIALASKHSAWTFSKGKTQNILLSIYNSYAKNGGFKYKYSGNYLSTRTNAIAFDILGIILSNLRYRFWYNFLNVIDKIRQIIGSNLVRNLIIVLLFLLFFYTIFLWWDSNKSPSEKIAELGPHFFVFILVLFYEFGRKSK